MREESITTVLTLLERQVAHRPDAIAVTLLHNGEEPEGTLTYRQLAHQAHRVAALLVQAGVVAGERVLLVYPEGLEFLPVFLGCLYAGVVAVPTPAPDALRSKRALPHMQAVYTDAQASRILTTERLRDLLPTTPAFPILTTDPLLTAQPDRDELSFADLSFPDITPDHLAYLQYTSGSTGTPKGVMITHANVVANLASLNPAVGDLPESVSLTWMPHTHDFGLVFGLLRPLMVGVPLYIMPPSAYLRRPMRWLKAISRFRITESGAATFAYKQCLAYAGTEECADLDLSHWRVAALGAEPIPAAMLEEFTSRFAPYGFVRDAFCPAYGLAEATVMLSTKPGGGELITRALTVEGRTRTLTGCGHAWGDTHIQIVDPSTRLPVAEGEIGEIWASGGSIGAGYWNRAEETQETFGNLLEGIAYLRTGDMGLIDAGTLFITGRLKDLIILNGQNYHPSDLEWCIEEAHPILKSGSKAAFAMDDPDLEAEPERLVLVCEVDGKEAKATDLKIVVQTIRERIALEFSLPVHAIVLVRRGSLPKTPSGKVQRRSTRTAWLNGELEGLHSWQLEKETLLTRMIPAEGFSHTDTIMETSLPQTSTEEMLAQIWREVLGVSSVSVTDNFFAIGGNSLLLVSAYSTLCQRLGRALPLVDLFTYPDIRSLARHLNGLTDGSGLAPVHERLVKKRAAKDRVRTDGIAIIGVTGRFPGANSVAQFWENLKNGIDSIEHFTDEELTANGATPELLQDPSYVKAAPVLENIEDFDPTFFGMSPREAAITDPQIRLWLECAWEACEIAGYDPKSYAGSIGVFTGSGVPAYLFSNLLPNHDCWERDGFMQIMFANEKDYMATKSSYKLGLGGPSFTVQTACSTSLVATHLACESLLNYECDMVIAGGVTVQLPHRAGYMYQEGGPVSPDGYCRSFDSEANGTVFGSGAAAVLLKRLEDAIADGDNILAVIKGSAISNDGDAKVGYTAPSVRGQVEAILGAVSSSGIPFEDIGYMEAHGTGTSMGDPIEIEALSQAFRTQTDAKSFCAIGSLKANVGHLVAASGVAGLIKAAMAIKHGQIPPSIHFNTPNPHIDFPSSPFYVNTSLAEWKSAGKPRVASVSAFGMGGTNAHAVLTEGPTLVPGSAGRPWLLFPLSARTSKALNEATSNLVGHLASQPDLSAPDVAYTLQVGRRGFSSRRLVLCRDTEEAVQLLEAGSSDQVFSNEDAPSERPVVFMFPGQGIDLVNQGREIYEAEPIFRENINLCANLLTPSLGQDIREILYPQTDRLEWAREQMRRTEVAQPAIFVFEYALAQLWRSWGVQPVAMIGHSLGEYVAACLSGVFSLEEGLRLVAERGKIMQQIPAGAMLAVALPEAEARELLVEGLWLAAVNAPNQCIFSGSPESIGELETYLASEGFTYARLATSHAFHSGMMDDAIAPLNAAVSRITLSAPQIPYLSNVTGTWIEASDLMSGDYFGRHLRHAVLYGAGLQRVHVERPNCLFLEVGPGTVLTRLAGMALGKQNCTAIASLNIPSSASKSRGKNSSKNGTETPSPEIADREQKALMEALGQLWVEGATVDWRSFSIGQRRRRVALPTYPFQRRRCWIEPDIRCAYGGDIFTHLRVTGEPYPADSSAENEGGRSVRSQKSSAKSASRSASSSRKVDINDWFYLPTWTQSLALPPVEAALAVSSTDGTAGAEVKAAAQIDWIVFADQTALSQRLIQRLQKTGARVIEVYQGEMFWQDGPQQFTIAPSEPDEYMRMMESVASKVGSDLRILHLWTLEDPGDASNGEDAFAISQEHGFHSLLAISQALQAHGLPKTKEKATLVVVTQNLCDVSGEERIDPEKATLLGPCLVIPQENPGVYCSCIDIKPAKNQDRNKDQSEGQIEWLVERIVAESGYTQDLVIAYRGRHRWLRNYHEVRLSSDQRQIPSLKQEGVYLITGGLGDIGLGLAEHLGRTARPHLVLLGRTKFPPREGWEEWIASHPETDPMGIKLSRLIALERTAASVTLVAADVADANRVQEVVDAVYHQFGTLNGVFHAAGTVHGDNAVVTANETSVKVAEAHFRPKILGLLAIEKALAGRDTEFCLLFGSMSAVLGGYGYTAYSSGNCFMDAFTEDRSRRSSLRWICINYDAWRPGELVTSEQRYDLTKTHSDSLTITHSEGMTILDQVLSISVGGTLFVSAVDLEPRLDKWVRQLSPTPQLQRNSLETEVKSDVRSGAKEADSDASHQQDAVNVDMSARDHIKTPYVPPTTATQKAVVEIWEDQLGISPIGIDDDFFELGGDSLLAMRLTAQVERRFKRSPQLMDFVYEPTIANLASQLDAMEMEAASAPALQTPQSLGSYDPDLLDALLDEVTNS